MKAIEQNIEKEIAQAVMGGRLPKRSLPAEDEADRGTAAAGRGLSADAGDDRRYRRRHFGALLLYDTGIYGTSETTFKHELFSNIAWGMGTHWQAF